MQQRKIFALLVGIAGLSAFWLAIAGISGYLSSTPAIADSNYVITSPPYLPVTMSVQGDNEGTLREFPLSSDPLRYRAFIQAVPNERYRLRITNNSDQRVGLVIAVDGRNIISGKKSHLKNNERMYILNPHDSADYEGWRSGQNQTNRFYFTHAADSYAAAWGDTSAMGVIAMAVYPERYRPPPPPVYYPDTKYEKSRPSAESRVPAAPAPAADAAAPPGTGYGESTYSPSVSVEFEPSSEPMERVFLKYEWRETLCRKNILPDCRRYDDDNRDNRFWPNDNDGFAPPPPR